MSNVLNLRLKINLLEVQNKLLNTNKFNILNFYISGFRINYKVN